MHPRLRELRQHASNQMQEAMRARVRGSCCGRVQDGVRLTCGREQPDVSPRAGQREIGGGEGGDVGLYTSLRELWVIQLVHST